MWLLVFITSCIILQVVCFKITGISSTRRCTDPMSGYKEIGGALQYDTVGDDNFRTVSWWSSTQWPKFKGRSISNTTIYEDIVRVPIDNAMSVSISSDVTELINNVTTIVEGPIHNIRIGCYDRRYIISGHTCIANTGNYSIVIEDGNRILFNPDECMDKSFDELQGTYYMRCILSKLLDTITCAGLLNGGNTVVSISDIEKSQYTDMELIDDRQGSYKQFLINLGRFYSAKSTLIGLAQSVELTKVRKVVRVGNRKVIMGVTSFKHSFLSQVYEEPDNILNTSNKTSADVAVKDSLLSIALCMVNKIRSNVGVQPVIGHAKADVYARWKGQVCAKCRIQSHSIGEDCREDKGAPWNYIRSMLGSTNKAGEILAPTTSKTEVDALEDAIEGWINSDGHYRIMIGETYRYMGMSYGIIDSVGSCVKRQWAGLFVVSGDEDVNQGVIEPSSSCPDLRPRRLGRPIYPSCTV